MVENGGPAGMCASGFGTWIPAAPVAGPWMPMMQVPVDGYAAGGGYNGQTLDPSVMQGLGLVPQDLLQGAEAMSAAGLGVGQTLGLAYPSENVVMAAGQYRELRPLTVPPLPAGGGFGVRFHAEPADLPAGLQLDANTGVIWGAPSVPMLGAGGIGDYKTFTVTATNASGTASAKINIKVVNFQPENSKIAHVSQLERNKYMVIIDTRS